MRIRLEGSHILPIKRDSFEETREFLLRAIDIMLDFVKNSNDRSCKILDFHHPEQLREVLDLDIPEHPLNLDQLLVDCKDALKYQVKTAHPHFFNQLSAGMDIVSLVGEWLTATANTNMFTYEIAPVFILMEEVTMQKMREIIGFKNGESILAPGGSVSSLYAALAARHKLFPDCKEKGNTIVGQLVMFTSEHSHYSIMGAGAVLGLGTSNVILIKTDKRGRMIVEDLEKAVQDAKKRGHVPFFVCATSGTTVLGAFDPIHPIADIAEKYGMWLHIDAAWGGGCLLSKKYKTRMAGVERAHSVSWNPHKLMGTHLQCSTIHFRYEGLLLSCNSMCADYLFQQDKHYDVSYDTGDKVIQCGRHNDIFKLWLMWRSKGDSGFEKQIDRLFGLSEYLVKKIKEKPDKFYLLIEEPECTNVMFWYIPPSLRHMPHGPDKVKKLGEITPKLKGLMMNTGTLMINYQPLDDIPNFFRNIISSQAVDESDVDFLLDEMDRLGQKL
uniref:Glutamate decarboxylase n=1 Tax=Strigamia maritima TaxID=126957 RepID=T1IV01_STRMM